MTAKRKPAYALTDAKVISNPEVWPLWPWLPLRRNVNCVPEFAVLWASDWVFKDEEAHGTPSPADVPVLVDRVRLYRIDLYNPPANPTELRKLEFASFDNVRSLLAADWFVD